MENSNGSNKQCNLGSLRRSLLLSLTATSLIPLLLLAAVVLYYLTEQAAKDVAGKNQLLARAISGQVEVFLRAPEASLLSLHDLQRTHQGNLNRATFQKVLDSLAESSSLIESIFITDRHGVVTDVGLPHKNIDLRAEFTRLELGHLGFIKQAWQLQQPVWSDTFLSIITGKTSLAIAIPADNRMIVGNISIELINRFLQDLHHEDRIESTIVDQHGEIIACSQTIPEMCPVNLWLLPLVRDAAKDRAQTATYEYRGETILGSVAQIDGPGWLTLVAQTSNDAYQPVRRTSLFFFSAILSTLFVVLLVALLISKRIAAPIQVFTQQTRKLADGDYGLQQLSAGYSEIAVLAEDFNQMVARIAERETALKDSETAYRTLAENLPAIAYRLHIHQGYRLQFMNDKYLQMTGFTVEDFAPSDCCPFVAKVHPDDRDTFVATIKTAIDKHTDFAMEYRFKHADADYRTFFEKGCPTYSANGEINHIDGVIFDVTEQKRAEEIILQSEKMLTVGGLAAGMAHEINNPLAGIMLNCQLIRQRLNATLSKNLEVAKQTGADLVQLQSYLEKRRIPKMLDDINASGLRAAKIVENMLGFSRKSHKDFSLQSLPGLIETALELARSDYDLRKEYDFRNIEIDCQHAENLPPVKCDPAQIQQVLLNLFKNGAQAMSEQSGGKPPRFQLRTYCLEGMVYLKMRDNGPGIPEAVQKRIFEPFFTTKNVGKGTGLGLSVCYFIITEKHHGRMTVSSGPGQGTEFTIALPLTAETGST